MRAALAAAALLAALACPATSDAAVGVIFHDGVLTASGDDGPDYLQVYCGSDGVPRVSGAAPSNQLVRCRQVTEIELYGAGGDDVIDMRLVGHAFGSGPGCFGGGGAGSDRYLSGPPFFEAFSGDDGADSFRGDGGFAFAFGGSGRDRLIGNSGSDFFLGNGNRDLLDGGGGPDVILGDSGNDLVRGGAAADDLFGGGGRDRLRGGRGDDKLDGWRSRDRIFGGPGDDRLFGGPGHDLLRGGPGADRRFPDGTDPDRPFTEVSGRGDPLAIDWARAQRR